MDNCMELTFRIPRIRRQFVFLDDWNQSALSLLCRNNVRIKTKEIRRQVNGKYQLVLCSVRRRDAARFARAMEDLVVKMLLIGNEDYEAFCRIVIGAMQGG